MKLKSFCTAKENVNKTKRNPSEWEKIFENYTNGKGLNSKSYNQLIHVNIKKKKKKQPNPKMDLQPKQRFLQRRQTDHQQHMKRCSTSLIIREIQIKTTVRYSLTPVSMAIMIKSTNNKCWRWCGEKGTILHCWWECKLLQPLWRTEWRFLQKLKIELPYDPAIPLLGIYPEKTIVQKESCTKMFIAALLTIARTQKQPKCPSSDEWIKKCGTYIQWNITQP